MRDTARVDIGMGTLVGFVGLILLALAPVACSQGGGAAPDSGAGGGGGALSTLTCQQIRLCVAQTPCATDACIQGCAAKGTPAAKTAYEALRACTAGVCAVDDVNCACNEQCNADGACLAEVDGCLAMNATDDICDVLCR